jgi:hypothetical protein
MKFLKKVLATCGGSDEVPLRLRNPYYSTFIERLLLQYQEPPTGHPYNRCEQAFTPETLQAIEQLRLMSLEEKAAVIKRQAYKWFDGKRAAPKDV